MSTETAAADYALVLNAGSSSLKFCVYNRPGGGAWRLESRGQIEGIGTAPRLGAKDEAGGKIADEALDASVRDGRAALSTSGDDGAGPSAAPEPEARLGHSSALTLYADR